MQEDKILVFIITIMVCFTISVVKLTDNSVMINCLTQSEELSLHDDLS